MFRPEQQIGSYELIKPLGKGGFGEVWLAEKRSEFVTKKVAVKLPHKNQINFEAIRQEATLWEKASGHPNVLPIIDADIYDGQVVIVSEYADGGSLGDKLKISLPPIEIAVEITIGILNGLEYLHSKEIIHRDIKPQNILLQGNTPRLADFGISRAMNSDTISSVVAGTDAYMSPEAFDGNRNVQTDIWSVGVVLYQMLNGQLPYPQQHPTERMFAILTKEFEPLGENIPKDVRDVVEKALAKKPADRYLSAVQMSNALRKILANLENPHVVPGQSGGLSESHNLETDVVNNQQTDERNEPKTDPRTIAQKTDESNLPTEVIEQPPASIRTEVKTPQENGPASKKPTELIKKPEAETIAISSKKKSKTKIFIGGFLLLFIFGVGALSLSGGAYYYYYVYLPGLEENIVGVRPSFEYKVGDIAREHIAPHANILFTDSKGNQITLKRGQLVVKKDELITPEIFEKVSAIYNYNDLSE
jgi:serine/threonine protein kinase